MSIEDNQERIKKQAQNFSASFMSNAKWRKLFSVINTESPLLSTPVCRWKLIDKELPEEGFVPDPALLNEYCVGDCGALNGPFEYTLIEWILLPRAYDYRRYENAPITRVEQDIDAIAAAIHAAGQFEWEQTDDGLMIYGYKQ